MLLANRKGPIACYWPIACYTPPPPPPQYKEKGRGGAKDADKGSKINLRENEARRNKSKKQCRWEGKEVEWSGVMSWRRGRGVSVRDTV